MFNKKFIFALIILIIAISSVSASDFNLTDDAYDYDSKNPETLFQNTSDVSLSESSRESGLADIDSDSLTAGQTVYFDASANYDGVGTQTSPYKFLYDSRITSGMTAYFADGIYVYDGSGMISSKTAFIGQSRENTIIRSLSNYYFDLTVSSTSSLLLKDMTLDYGHIINQGDLNADNVAFINSKCDYDADSSAFTAYGCGGAIFSNPSEMYACNINLNNCYFDTNHARHGGAIAANYSNIVITNCVFSNSISNRSGGAIYSLNSNVTVSKSSFTKSNAKYGGAIYTENGNINLFDSNFTTSQAYSFGGSIASILTHSTIGNCNFLNYWSQTDSGGAIYTENGFMDISRSSFTNGIADFGGAICALSTYSTISESNFQNNTANYGGSIFNMYNDLYISNSNFKSSSAYYGGAICSYLGNHISLTDNVFVNADDVYVFAKTTTSITKNANTGLTNVQIVNTTLFDIGSDVIAPIINYSLESQSTIPSYYDSRDYGYVTPVKNQMDGGNCWAFTSIATLEICLKKATGLDFDFSEENVKNLMAMYSLVGRIDEETNQGGTDSMAFGYFIDWLGPINDAWDVYDDYSTLSSIYSPLLHVQNVYFLPTRKDTNDNDAIKKAIMDYGAVATGTFWKTSNHAITLIGWNDNYNAKDYFGNFAKGVWIVKNSWGDEYGDDGYVYVSYEKTLLADSPSKYHNYIYTYIFNDTESYSRNYQYDLNGVNYYVVSTNDVVSYKNVFFAQDNEILSAFSTVFKVPANYRVTLYKGNDLILTQQGYSPAGYYTIPFKTKTTLSKGDKFTICIDLLNSGDKYVPLSNSAYSSLGTFENGISYMDLGNGWSNLYSYFKNPYVACIKAFTTPLRLTEVTLSANQITRMYTNEAVEVNFKLSNNQLNEGLITVNLDGKNYYATVSNGVASFWLYFTTVGSHTLKAQYKNNLYTSNIVNFSFDVVQQSGQISVSAPDLTKYYGSSSRFEIRVTDGGRAVSGAYIKFTRGSSSQTVVTNSNGYAYVDVDWAPGTYYVTSEYLYNSVTSKITVKPTISTSDLNADYGSSYFKANFYNIDGSALSNTAVKFRCGGLLYGATTNSNGVATYNIKLNVGNYDVTAINPINGEEKTFKLNVKKAYPTIYLNSTQNGRNVNLTASLVPGFATGNVIFTVGGNHTNFTRSLQNGEAILSLNLNDGYYEAYVTYVGDSNVYSSKSSIISFRVSTGQNVEISAPDLTKYYGSSSRFSIKVTDDNRAVIGANVKFSHGSGSRTVVTNSNGYAYVDVDWAPGIYYVTSEYLGKSVNSKITVKSTISASDVSGTYLNSIITATFLDIYGKALAYKDVTFKIGINDFVVTTDANGVATVKVDLISGDYIVTVVNPVNNEEKQFNLFISKANSSFTLDVGKNDDGKIIITATVSPGAATGYVKFKFEGSSMTYANIISNRKATLVSPYSAEGTYNLVVSYDGDSNFNAAPTKNFSYTIHIQKPVLTAKDVTAVYGNNKDMVIYLKEADGKPIPNKRITIKFVFGGKYYSCYGNTGTSGGLRLSSAGFAPGTYTAYISSENCKQITAKMIIKKATVKLTAKAKTFKKSVKIKKYTITLKNNLNKVMKSIKVTLKVNGKTYSAKTNSKGQATFKITKLTKKGKFTAVVKYGGNKFYNSKTVKPKITVK